MHITEVRASNLKGRSFAKILAPATLIVGPNFSGKTAILDAIRFALIGHLPEVGRKNSATFELASGREMDVSLAMDSGGTIERSLQREKGVVKAHYAFQNIPNDSGHGTLVCPLLDASEYWSLTDSQRIDYIFARVVLPDEYTAAGIMAKLHRLSFGEKHTEELENAKTAVLAQCQAVLAEVPSLPEALTKLTGDTLKKEFSEWNGAASRSQGAVVLLTELKNREGECSAETLQDLRAEAAALRSRLEESNRALGALQGQVEAAAQNESRRVELTARLAKEEPKWEEPVMAKVKRFVGEGTGALVELLAAVEAKLTALPAFDPKVRTAHELSLAVKRCTAQAVKVEQKSVAAMDARISDLEARTCCPFCKSDEAGWRDRVKSELQVEADTLRATLKQAALEADAAEKREAKVREDLAAAQQVDVTRAEFAIRREEIQQAITDIEQANLLGLAVAKRADDKADLDFRVAKVSLRRDRENWAAGRQRDQEELATIESVPAPTAEELAEAKAHVAADGILLTIASDKIATAERLQNDLLRASQAAEEHRKAAARRDVIKAVGQLLQDQKGEMVAAAFKELLTIANGIAGDILTSPLAYHEGEIGMFSSSGFIKHRTMSGTEQALTFVAIAAALSSKAPFRLLILDELARFTPALQQKVLASFSAAVEREDLDQVIAVLPMDGPAPELPGWTVIATGRESK